MNFFRGIPEEFEESAVLDGANSFQIMTRIYLPISKPSIATKAEESSNIVSAKVTQAYDEEKNMILLDKPDSFQRPEPNVLLLDYAMIQ